MTAQTAILATAHDHIETRFKQAMDTVETHTYYSAGIGILPFPVLDFVGITTNQVWMIRKIGELYNQKFSNQWAKKILAALLGGSSPVAATYGGLGSFAKSIPVIGPILGLTVTPVLAGAATYAVGSVFVTYYENGGAFELFNPNDPSIQDQMKKMIAVGENLVKNAHAQDRRMDQLSADIKALEDKVNSLAHAS